MRFEFAAAGRIIFGPGTRGEVPGLAAELGKKIFVVAGSNLKRVSPFLEELKKAGLVSVAFQVANEPTIELVQTGVEAARQARSEAVIGIGGGSVLDTGKAIAALLANGGGPLDYLEVIGLGRKLTEPSYPYIAVPTTAGTGAEVTRNAVLSSPENKVKVSMRSPLILPRLAVVDPALTYTLPPEITASTGLDALTQLLEPFVSRKANPFTDQFCRQGLRLAATSLRRVYENGNDQTAREKMSLASLLGGLALANAGLGAAHGFAGPLGGIIGAPHGALCARLLPPVMEANILALRERDEGSALARYEEAARILTGKDTARPEDGVAWTKELVAALNVPPLNKYGLKREDIPSVVEKAKKSSSMKGNPVELTEEELLLILTKAI